MPKILIVDDEEINRVILENGLNDLYEVELASDGKEALDHLCCNETIDAVLLDLYMPKLNGFEVLKKLKETGLLERIPVFIITAESDDDSLLDVYEIGAADIIRKPFNIRFLRRRVSNIIELYSQRNNLSKLVDEKSAELIRQNNRLVEALADIVEFRSQESGTHVKRVSGYTRILMNGLVASYPEYNNLQKDIENISFASCLHDLGKIAIPDNILNKPGKLDAYEFDVMKSHTIHGHEKINALKDIMAPNLFMFSMDIARHHHERFDGKGYPDMLSGDDIPIWSQVVGLADVYDALTTERVYKKAFDHEKACSMITDGECGCFNPKILQVFSQLNGKIDELRKETVEIDSLSGEI